MGVLATFDAAGRWDQTHVCDSLLLDHLARLGAAWGRFEVQAPWPRKGPLAVLLDSRRMELGQLHARFDTESVNRVRLSPKTSRWATQRHDWRRLQAHKSPTVHWVLEGTLLVYLQTESGYVGVLCEAGEWLAIPASARHSRDAGEAPDVDVLVLSSVRPQPEPLGHGDEVNCVEADEALPSLDAFVETMLELTGHAEDE